MSLSYSQLIPIAPRETFTVGTPLGTYLDRGEILWSFYGKLKRPDEMKSRCGMKATLSFLLKNRPTSGKSTHLPLMEHYE